MGLLVFEPCLVGHYGEEALRSLEASGWDEEIKMKFVLQIQMGDAAMSKLWDVQHALVGVANQLLVMAQGDGDKLGEFRHLIRDENGNTVGHFELVEE